MKIPTFREWLQDQTKHDNPLGDFARDVVSSATHPLPSDDAQYTVWISYLTEKSACPEAYKALEKSWALWCMTRTILLEWGK